MFKINREKDYLFQICNWELKKNHLWSNISLNINENSKIRRFYWKDFYKYIESTKTDGETTINA